MIASQLHSEWMRGRGRAVEKYTGAIVIALGVVVPIVMLLVSSSNARMRAGVLGAMALPASLSAARTVTTLIGPICAAALGANIIGAEYQFGTWPLLLVRTSSRGQLIFVKIVTAAARIIGLTIVGTVTFIVMGALVCLAYGAPMTSDAIAAEPLLISFVLVGGTMAFAAAIAFAVTVASRSVVFGTLTGVLALPLFSAIEFKETAAWIPYIHLANIQARLLDGRPPPSFSRLYEFNMSARASAGILAGELLVVLAISYVIFRRQEIVY